MTDAVDTAMREVWEWKRQAEDRTRGMTTAQIIEFYRNEAESVQSKLGLRLPSEPAAKAAYPTPVK